MRTIKNIPYEFEFRSIYLLFSKLIFLKVAFKLVRNNYAILNLLDEFQCVSSH